MVTAGGLYLLHHGKVRIEIIEASYCGNLISSQPIQIPIGRLKKCFATPACNWDEFRIVWQRHVNPLGSHNVTVRSVQKFLR